MNTMVKKGKIKIRFLVFICLVGFMVFSVSNPPRSDFITEDDLPSFTIKSANNDTTAPTIIFIKPDNNDSIINVNYYDVIVNITDENPPLPGNVSIEISNATDSLFNATMTKDVDGRWYFIWNNLTAYDNEQTYIMQVSAKDSSSNENIGKSEEISIYVEIYSSRSPGFINGIIYIIVASLLIAGILVYFNRKKAIMTPRRD
jgi:hypothetical protein